MSMSLEVVPVGTKAAGEMRVVVVSVDSTGALVVVAMVWM
jgi:hypothetical protein